MAGEPQPASIDGEVIRAPSPPPAPPDRPEFQRGLSSINTSISHNTKRLNQLVGRAGYKSLIAEASENRSSIRKQREALKEETDALKKQIDGKIKGIEELRDQMKQLEPELQWRNAEKLDAELKSFESKYKNQMKNNREEKYVVGELDRLKRNKKKLERYNQIIEERRDIEVDLSVLKLARDESFRKQMALRKDQTSEVSKRNKLRDEAQHCRNQLSELISDRQRMVGEYNAALSDYTQWATKNKASYNNNNNSPVEVEELEPFYEQKRDCRLLISYLERLDQQFDPSSDATVVVDDESGDEFPESFKSLCMAPASRKKKHHHSHHKKAAKAAQPLSHVFDIYKLFGTLEIEAPKYSAEVKEVLAKVRETLAHYESQTVSMEWDEEIYGLGAHANDRSIARTMSTADSAFDHSETASVSSGRYLFSPSPLVMPRRDSQRFSRNDEGLGSRDSAVSPLSPPFPGSPV